METAVVPHLDKHVFATTPVFVGDNTRPHQMCSLMDFLQRNAIANISWPAQSLDLNSTEYMWDILGRRILQSDPPIHNLEELSAVLHQKWWAIPQHQTQHLSIARENVLKRSSVSVGVTRY